MTLSGCLRLLLFGIAFFVINASVADDFAYDGRKKCSGCHKSQYKSWKQTDHAKALESLRAGEKSEAKEKAGLDPAKDYSEDKKCVACHSTGFGMDGGYEIEDPSKYTVGVGCESCHGPEKSIDSCIEKLLTCSTRKRNPRHDKHLQILVKNSSLLNVVNLAT